MPAPAASGGRMTVIGIVTHDRLPALVSCVESYLANCHRHQRLAEVVVMNDGSDSDVRSALRVVSAQTGAAIWYAGLAEKRRFADALARESSVSPAVIDFAMFGDARVEPRIGANRNCLVLDTVGSLVFAADDDTMGRVGSAPACDESIEFSTAYEPREFWFFPDRRAALEHVPAEDADFLAGHEQLLGRTLATDGGSEPRVAITVPGLVGDSGMGSPRHFLALDGPSRERLVSSCETYSTALRCREVLRTVRRPTIAETPFCMTTFLGMDNTRFLPPFFPVARNSDGVFGLTLRRASERSRVAFLPSVLLHAPPEPRAFAGDEAWTEPARIRMADVLISAMLAHNPGANDGDAARLQRMGRFLQELASVRIEEFDMFVASAQQLRNLTLTNTLDTRLREYDSQPGFWADDVKRTIDLLRRAPADPSYVVPRDVCAPIDVSTARQLSRELVARFGELLEAWPSMVEAAGRLRAGGRRVSEAV